MYLKSAEFASLLLIHINITMLLMKVYYLKLVTINGTNRKDHYAKINNICSMTCSSYHEIAFVFQNWQRKGLDVEGNTFFGNVLIPHYFPF
jgi:hypothetical protein